MNEDIAFFLANQEISIRDEMPEGISFPMDTTQEVAVFEGKLHEYANLKQVIVSRFSTCITVMGN